MNGRLMNGHRMTTADLPILYSFRRCPFAMRARMAIKAAAHTCELREVVLRDKPEEMIAVSPKATVPVLVDRDGTVRDESLEIMQWVLALNDPEAWLDPPNGTVASVHELIATIDGPFKRHLDRYKYANRYAHENNGSGVDPVMHRMAALEVLNDFEQRLEQQDYLFGDRLCLADVATAPFIRQFANTDRAWFEVQPLPNLQRWLDAFLQSGLFLGCMQKHPQWKSGEPGVIFPG